MKIFLLTAIVFFASLPSTLVARTWTSAQGGFTLEADAIAFNDTTVVLKKSTGNLVAVEIRELSNEDQAFVKSKELGQTLNDRLETMQTWTSKDGVKIRGRVLQYGRKDLSITRQRGIVVVNGKAFSNIDPLHQRLVYKFLSELTGQSIDSEQQLTTWAKTLGGQPKVYPLEGVLMELESGDQIAVPFFLFSSQDRQVLEPGWQAWVRAQEDEAAQQRESLMMQSEAQQYQADQSQQQQVELLKLHLLAAASGVTSIWEVGLQPGPGVYGRRTSVMVTAPNSQIAAEMALQNYPGYVVFGIRKASRF